MNLEGIVNQRNLAVTDRYHLYLLDVFACQSLAAQRTPYLYDYPPVQRLSIIGLSKELVKAFAMKQVGTVRSHENLKTYRMFCRFKDPIVVSEWMWIQFG